MSWSKIPLRGNTCSVLGSKSENGPLQIRAVEHGALIPLEYVLKHTHNAPSLGKHTQLIQSALGPGGTQSQAQPLPLKLTSCQPGISLCVGSLCRALAGRLGLSQHPRVLGTFGATLPGRVGLGEASKNKFPWIAIWASSMMPLFPLEKAWPASSICRDTKQRSDSDRA